jgi:hypothetical protein
MRRPHHLDGYFCDVEGAEDLPLRTCIRLCIPLVAIAISIILWMI